MELHTGFCIFAIKYILCTYMLHKQKLHGRVRIRKTISFVFSFLTHAHYLDSALPHPPMFSLLCFLSTCYIVLTCTLVYTHTHAFIIG